MKPIDPSVYPAPMSATDSFAPEDRTIVLVTISRHCGDDVISRIKSALPDSDIINLSQLSVDRDAGAPTPGPMAPPSPLTDRQREILDYLLGGLSNKEIGRKLDNDWIKEVESKGNDNGAALLQEVRDLIESYNAKLPH